MEGMKINAEQLANYQRDGYLVIEGFASAPSCDELRARALHLVEGFDPNEAVSIFTTRDQRRDQYFLESGDKIRFFFEERAFLPDGRLGQRKEESINKIGHALHDLDPVFARFSRTTALCELTSALGVRQPLLLQSMYIFKQPNIGGEVDCHQDATFLYTEPPSAIGFWFALEDATRENGCLWAIPGGHRQGLKSRYLREGSSTRFMTIDSSPWPLHEAVPLEVKKGALIVLHCLLPHMSGANRSARSRHAYTLHVIDGQCRYPEDNWLQRAPDLPLRGFRAD